MFRRVIVAFDGSERAMDALVLAETLAAADGELLVCCIHHYQALSARIDPTEPAIDRQAARRAVEQAAGLLRGDLKMTAMSLPGASAAGALQGSAQREHADLIVLGSSHRGTLGRVLLGSVTQETLHDAPCPVAIAPVGFHTEPQNAPLRRVAVGLDSSDPVPAGLTAAAALCQERAAELRVVAVVDDTVSRAALALLPYSIIREERRLAAERAVGEALQSLPDTVSARSEVRDGNPVEQLLDVSGDVDLLVLASHGRGLLGRLALGSVCDAVVRAAACPVLVIPPIHDATGDPGRDPHQAVGAEGS
jgi:nucleotide-binding universal stress UspA family protein